MRRSLLLVILLALSLGLSGESLARGRSSGSHHSSGSSRHRSSSSYARSGSHRSSSHSSGHRSYSSHSYGKRSYHSYRPHRSTTFHYHKPRTSHTRAYAYGVQRDSHGRIKRSEAAKHAFMRMTGYPHGRPGYVIDHIVPLKRGGRDDPGNMQWQTKEEAKAKDRWE
jgi:hypothetical protein